jgi:membrane-associated protease RseP (regulator of RpoE activity)
VKILAIIPLLRKLPLSDLMNVPKDIYNSQAVRRWLQAVTDTLLILTEMTNIKTDNEFVKTVQKVFGDDQAWSVIHNLVCDFIDIKNVFTGDETPDTVSSVYEAAEIIGTNPSLIIAIVQAIISLLSFFKK